MKIRALNLNSFSKATSVTRGMGLMLVAAILTGCPASNQTSQSPAAEETKSNPNKIVIRGSNTIGEELAPKLIAEFKKENASIEFDIETKATGYGFAALRAHKCDIAAASRFPSKEEQAEAASMNVVLGGNNVGSYSVAVIVNAKNSVSSLSKDQVAGIFTGSITNWQQVGGPDSAIHIVARDPISGTYLGFKEVAMNNQAYATDKITFADSYSSLADKVGMDASAIGYTGIQTEPASVKAVSIEGIEPSAANINAGKYPYTRGLFLYTRKGDESSAAKSFVDYVTGAKGQAIVAQLGFVPHS